MEKKHVHRERATYNWPFVVNKFDDPMDIISNSWDMPMLVKYEYCTELNHLEKYVCKHLA